MFCFHKYDKVVDGYQYCTKCGKAIAAPCPHSWKKLERHRIKDAGGVLTKVRYVLGCEKCGELKEESF